MNYISDKDFSKVKREDLALAEYENCTFQDSDLTEFQFKHFKFIDCTFESCNLSLAQVSQCSFQNVRFIDCKMVGILFEQVNSFSLEFTFQSCNLSQCSFYSLSLKNTQFLDCMLHEVDFTETILSNSDFTGSDLLNAIFDSTNLERASVISALNFDINPLKNRTKKLKISISGLPGLLSDFDLDIHK
jgi:fluoroquinolone resistance protein